MGAGMENSLIQCPKCAHEFELSEALTATIREHLNVEFQQKIQGIIEDLAAMQRLLSQLSAPVPQRALEGGALGDRTATPWSAEVAAAAPSESAGAKDASTEVRELIRGELAAYLTTPFDALKRLVAEGSETFESNRLEGGRKVNVRVTADWTRHGKAVRVTMDIQGGPWPLQERTAFFIMDESGRVVDQSRWLHA